MAELSTPGAEEAFEGRLFVHLADIDRVFRAVVKKDADNWNYDDVIAALQQAGFQHFCPAYWLENSAEWADTEAGDDERSESG